MKPVTLLLAFLLIIVPVAAEPVMPVDAKQAFCDEIGAAFAGPWCAVQKVVKGVGELVGDTSNKLSESEVDAGVSESDTARDVETAILEKEIDFSKDRVAKAWSDVLSLVVLVVEMVRVVFYLAQIFILVHLPYWYVKFLVFVKSKAFKVAARGGARS